MVGGSHAVSSGLSHVDVDTPDDTIKGWSGVTFPDSACGV